MRVHSAGVEDLESTLDGFLMFGQTTSAVIVTSSASASASASASVRPLPIRVDDDAALEDQVLGP